MSNWATLLMPFLYKVIMLSAVRSHRLFYFEPGKTLLIGSLETTADLILFIGQMFTSKL